MRIISGTFRGKKILEPKDVKTRPLKDLTKESIFNILNHSNKLKINLENSDILDLFSGVGSFGIECLSRGVKNVKSGENYEIIEKDIDNGNIRRSLEKKFDIIFMDPPYKDKNLNLLLENLNDIKILNENGIIVIHRHKNEQDIIPKNFKVIEKKKYGLSKIIFLSFLN